MEGSEVGPLTVPGSPVPGPPVVVSNSEKNLASSASTAAASVAFLSKALGTKHPKSHARFEAHLFSFAFSLEFDHEESPLVATASKRRQLPNNAARCAFVDAWQNPYGLLVSGSASTVCASDKKETSPSAALFAATTSACVSFSGSVSTPAPSTPPQTPLEANEKASSIASATSALALAIQASRAASRVRLFSFPVWRPPRPAGPRYQGKHFARSTALGTASGDSEHATLTNRACRLCRNPF